MKKSFIYNCLPLLFAAMATFSFTACGGGDGDDTDYAAIAAMQGALGGGTGGSMLDSRIVDLGLSVKWASCNVGATQPWEYGGYYAWGETEEKSDYSYNTYKYYGRNNTGITKYCTNSSDGTVDNKTTLEPTDDVATVKWGGTWRMPTRAEQDELRNSCTWTWTTLNGVNGYRVTGPNGNSIFLPAAGSRTSTAISEQGTYGIYWSSSIYNSWNGGAYYIDFYDHKTEVYYHNRMLGHTVRPVCP